MKLLLHTCCADCLIRYLEILDLKPKDELLINNSPHPSQDTDNPFQFQLSDLTIYYANSNIYPKSEYDHRLETLREITNLYQLPLIIADYQPQDFFQANSSNFSNSTSGFNTNLNSNQLIFSNQTRRCPSCWQRRLTQTLDFALQKTSTLNFTHFSTTLLVSQYQNNTLINQIGSHLAQNHSPALAYFSPDTKPAQFYKTGGFYKQNYCGCLYSLIEKTNEKYF